jgi:hypothetical protein
MEKLYEQGKYDEKVETIKRATLLNDKLTIDDLAKLVGLSNEKICEIRDEYYTEMLKIY